MFVVDLEASLVSNLASVKYKLELPSATESVLKDIFALPLNATPLIVLLVANIVDVAAFPVISPVKLLFVVKFRPVVIHAELAEFLIFKTPAASSIHHSYWKVVEGAEVPALLVAIADKALLRSALKFAPDWLIKS